MKTQNVNKWKWIVIAILFPVYLNAQIQYPVNHTVENITISSGTTAMYKATGTLTIKGVTVNPGGKLVCCSPNVIVDENVTSKIAFSPNVKIFNDNPNDEKYGTTYDDLTNLDPALKNKIDNKTKFQGTGFPSSLKFGTWMMGVREINGTSKNQFEILIDHAEAAGINHIVVYALAPNDMYYFDLIDGTYIYNEARYNADHTNAVANIQYIISKGLQVSLFKNGKIDYINNNIGYLDKVKKLITDVGGSNITYYFVNDEMNRKSNNEVENNLPGIKFEEHSNYSNSAITFTNNLNGILDPNKLVVGPMHDHLELLATEGTESTRIHHTKNNVNYPYNYNTWQLSELISDNLDNSIHKISLSWWPYSAVSISSNTSAKYIFYDVNDVFNNPYYQNDCTGYTRGVREFREIAMLKNISKKLNDAGNNFHKHPPIIGGINFGSSRHSNETSWVGHAKEIANVEATRIIIHFFEGDIHFSFWGNTGYSGTWPFNVPLINNGVSGNYNSQINPDVAADRTQLWEIYRTLNHILYDNDISHPYFRYNESNFTITAKKSDGNSMGNCEVLPYAMVRQKLIDGIIKDYELYIFVLSPLEYDGTTTISIPQSYGFNYPAQIPLYYNNANTVLNDVQVNSLNYTIESGNILIKDVAFGREPLIIRLVQEPYKEFECVSTANAGTDIPLCNATSTPLAAQALITDETGQWTIQSGTGGNFSIPNSPTSSFTGNANSSYTLRWTITNSKTGCYSYDDVIVTFTNPTTANAGNYPVMCNVTSINLSANTPDALAGETGLWTIVSGTGGGFGASYTSTSSSPSTSFNGSANTTYIIRWTLTRSGCSSSSDVTIQFSNVSAVNVSGSGTFCNSTTITASDGSGGTIYYQGTTNGTSTADASTSKIITSSGSYYFRSMSAAGCWGTEGSASVTITANPSATIWYSGSPFCNSLTTAQNVTLTGTTGGTYTASPDGLTINSSTGAITPSTSTVGAYTVTYTIAASGGCNAFSTIASVTINNVPSAPTVQPESGVTCNSFTANWSSSSGANTYYYLDVAIDDYFTAFVSYNMNVGNVILRNVTGLSGNTTYYYRVRAGNGCGTSGNSGTETVITSASAGGCPNDNNTWGGTIDFGYYPNAVGHFIDICQKGGYYFYLDNLQAGTTYKFSTCIVPNMCDASNGNFDTQLTIYPQGGGCSVAYNDDNTTCNNSENPRLSTILFQPTTTGNYVILTDEYDCTSTSTSSSIETTLSIDIVGTAKSSSITSGYLNNTILSKKEINIETGNKILLYPNPTPGKFVVDMGFEEKQSEVEIIVYNVLGEIVSKAVLNNIQKIIHEIDLSKKENGIYFISINPSNVNIAKKEKVILTK